MRSNSDVSLKINLDNQKHFPTPREVFFVFGKYVYFRFAALRFAGFLAFLGAALRLAGFFAAAFRFAGFFAFFFAGIGVLILMKERECKFKKVLLTFLVN